MSAVAVDTVVEEIELWELHSELVLVSPEVCRRALELLPERDPDAFLVRLEGRSRSRLWRLTRATRPRAPPSSSGTRSGESDRARASLSPSPSGRSPSHCSPKWFARPPLVRQAGLLASRDSWARHEAQCVCCVVPGGVSAPSQGRSPIWGLSVVSAPTIHLMSPGESGGRPRPRKWRGFST